MRQFVADAPKAHESLSTEARRVPVQGTPISPLIGDSFAHQYSASMPGMVYAMSTKSV